MAEERTHRRLAAILAADVVGYSHLMEQDERETLERFRAHRQELFEPEVGRHSGRIFKLTGDGFLAEFASVVDAVECAVMLQRKMAARNQSAADGRRMDVRLAVNLGDVIVEGEDRLGEGVIIASRLEALADPGGVLISGPAFDQVKNKTGHRFEDLGVQALKNIAEPVRVYRIACTPTVSAVARKAATDRPTIAVLPFTNMSDDREQQYFSDGITEDIITELQRFRSLLVIARNSSFQYRNRAADITRIGQELGARYVVEGSIRRRGERLRITAQLIDAQAGTHLWADRYDRSNSDIFDIQDEISRCIVTTLWSVVDDTEGGRAKLKGTSQMAAYDYVLKARHVWFNFTPEANSEARILITKALEFDPQYATAWSWFAWINIADWRNSWGDDPERSFGLAMDAANKAITLDPHDYFSHWPLAYLLVRSRRYDEGLAEYEKAFALNPNDSRFLDEMSAALCLVGRASEAIAQMELAMRLDPLHPDWFFGTLGFAHYVMREYDKAIAAMARMGNTPDYRGIRAAAYAQLGHQEEARATLAEYLRLRPRSTVQVASRIPFKNPADLEHLLDGLRKAGLQEE